MCSGRQSTPGDKQIRDGPLARPLLDFYVDAVSFDFDREAAHGRIRWEMLGFPCTDVELPAMSWTLNNKAMQIPFNQGRLSVSAQVIGGVIPSIHQEQGDVVIFHGHQKGLAGMHVIR